MKKTVFALCLISVMFSCKKEQDNQSSIQDKQFISYGCHNLQQFQLFLPDNHDENTPVAILVHGGGWTLGYKPNQKVPNFSHNLFNIQDSLIKRGYACAVMKYRLACYKDEPGTNGQESDFHFNQMMEDIDLTIGKLQSISSEYKISVSDYHLIGESAGGHLVMSYGVRANSNPTIKSIVSMFGPSNLSDGSWIEQLTLLPDVSFNYPNYFPYEDNNCNLTTNKTLKLQNWITSFGNLANPSFNGPNPELNIISPAQPENINNSIPIFIQHGQDDLLVPVSQAHQMFNGIESVHGDQSSNYNDLSVQYKRRIYPACGHGWTGNDCNREEILQDVVTWVDNH